MLCSCDLAKDIVIAVSTRLIALMIYGYTFAGAGNVVSTLDNKRLSLLISLLVKTTCQLAT